MGPAHLERLRPLDDLANSEGQREEVRVREPLLLPLEEQLDLCLRRDDRGPTTQALRTATTGAQNDRREKTRLIELL